MISIHKGVYAYGKDYDNFDVAQKLVSLSYLLLYTTIQMHGLSSQYYSIIYSISLKGKKYKIEGQVYIYHGVKDEIFYNAMGLVSNGKYTFADKERTICDSLYVFPRLHFDKLGGFRHKYIERDIHDI